MGYLNRYIMMLPSWYPSKLSPFNGDFIKRHAEAVSIYEEVQVIYIVKDEKGTFTKDVLKEVFTKGQLTETIIYYHVSSTGSKLFDKLASEKKYRGLYKETIDQYINENGKPALVHVHVGLKAGVMALWLKKKFSIPYVVTEHWSGFLEQAGEKFSHLPFYLRWAWKKVIQQASGISAVSNTLAAGLSKIFKGAVPVVTPNVVNTDVFLKKVEHIETPRFIHISGLDELKNPKLILEAFRIVADKIPGASLDIIGSTREEIVEYAIQLGLKQSVSFQNEIPQPELADYLRQSTALVLYSSYETFGCVIIEANACGVPVIVSDIPVFHETVAEGVNGYFSKPGNPQSLAERMLDIIKNRSSFNSTAISTMTGSKYSYPVVGKQFSDWYNKVLKKV